MNNGKPARTAAAVAARANLKAAGRKLLRDDLTPREFFDLLREQQRHADAIRFLAHSLPKRAAVWWGCLCAWHVARPEPPEPVATALEAAVRWVRDPSEENRRAAEAAGRAATLRTPAGCLAMGVFWSGGSMLPTHLPAVPPKPHVTAQLVSAAVLVAAAVGGSARQRDHLRRQFLAFGQEVAGGRNLWTLPAVEGAEAPEGESSLLRCPEPELQPAACEEFS